MEQRTYGKTGMKVSVLGFGGSEIGYEGKSTAEVERLLGRALDAGLNVIDTAECYKNSEELIGQTVAHRRSDYYLFTKCGHASGLDGADWDPAMLEQSIDRSLKRLKTDYIDVIHLHSCSEEVLRRGEVIEVLRRAREKGKTRFIGYSGDHLAAKYAVESGFFDSLMTSLNIADQEALELTIPKAMRREMGVVIKRPIANVAWRHTNKPDEKAYEFRYWERLRKLDYDFLTNSEPEAVGTALRFTLSSPGVHTAIVGTANPNRWDENSRLLSEGPLPSDQYHAVRDRWKSVASSDWIGLG
ncbi:aldo/keto reductase [Cohnella pontilimi]|uniref:Aldo/keto reductase n=1 Tax=Cohnella pontilimi TaxID=2564100 RepID=A0A4U0FI15_9BACL|nr:aldo/keto reductase [Cohnella pontilimi]TJY44094.1 aldo/keto reductase [Cohnella pontilimi]